MGLATPGQPCRHERRALDLVAKNLGHSDTRMVEKHYRHLAPSYVADAIRAGAPRFGGTKPSTSDSLEADGGSENFKANHVVRSASKALFRDDWNQARPGNQSRRNQKKVKPKSAKRRDREMRMSTFILTIDLDGIPHSPQAHRHLIALILDNTKQAVGSNEATEGPLRHPGGTEP